MLRDQVSFLCDLYREGFYIDRHEGSLVTLIYFSGLVDPTGFALVRSRLSRMKVNCIYLYDISYMNYLFGLRQLGADFRQTNAALLQRVRDLEANRIVTIGNSAGGFAAIKYALSLEAHASVTFSPFTSFTEEHHLKDGRGKAVVDRVRKADPNQLFDLLPLLAQRAPPLQLACFFAEGMPKDAWHAKRVVSCHGLPVRVCGLTSHYVLGSLVTDGIFDDPDAAALGRRRSGQKLGSNVGTLSDNASCGSRPSRA